ncbi:myb-like DNA-binding domain-containing protein [Colletotrichum higginsianum IMI 349063]|uniref:Myb-like DNA-binding domain-containing protein n=2 Tax=Colletotrichum higginsianum TaxID=80884 RepID=A0A1B7YQI6_COLHI|nr:myb-like DNA-binding domain-containing protein [Colletotrichum higginsianum IMI 349063]OBR14306.1 myb-like DNA-binding domain-containing protein [Colletotrichum higginsianum IMI 349063]TID02283.1 Transcription factor TFIIIB component B'' [Colletotrichum higginsianum]
MSSMFKKKGGMAFKPKMPQARPRAPGAAVPQPSRAPSSTATEAATETVPVSKDTTVQETVEIGAGAKGPARDQPTTTPPSTGPPSTTQTAIPQAHPPADELAAAAAAAASISEKASAAFISQQTTRAPAASAESTTRPAADSASVAGTPAQLQTPPATAPSATEVVPTTETQAPNGAETASTAKGGAPNATTEAPAKRPRKRATQTAENGETGEDGTAAPKSKRPRKQKDPTTDGEGAPKRAPRPRKKPTTMTTTEDGAATETDTPRSSSARPRRARSVTPEDAENQEADLSTLTMGDLTRDLRIGKKFSRHDELLQRHREKQARARERLKAKRNGSEDVASESGTPAPTTSGGATPAAVPPPQATSMASTGPQFQIIDGQIVVDQNSLSLDRHAIAAAAAEGEDMLEIEENDFTTLTTQNSYRTGSKLKGPNVWTEEETELFYRGLRMFGTDFQMISGMFPGKNRRHVKMKFNREERHAPARIDAILVGKKELHINLEEYKTWTKAEYEPVEAIMAAQRAQQAKFDAEQAKIKAAKDAINARNLASLQDKGEGGEPAEEESAAGGGGGGGKPKPRQQQANVGPQITVDADGMITIDETNMDPDAGRGKKRGAAKAKKKAVEYNMRGEIINR